MNDRKYSYIIPSSTFGCDVNSDPIQTLTASGSHSSFGVAGVSHAIVADINAIGKLFREALARRNEYLRLAESHWTLDVPTAGELDALALQDAQAGRLRKRQSYAHLAESNE